MIGIVAPRGGTGKDGSEAGATIESQAALRTD
jgi:hypothetical protein